MWYTGPGMICPNCPPLPVAWLSSDPPTCHRCKGPLENLDVWEERVVRRGRCLTAGNPVEAGDVDRITGEK